MELRTDQSQPRARLPTCTELSLTGHWNIDQEGRQLTSDLSPIFPAGPGPPFHFAQIPNSTYPSGIAGTELWSETGVAAPLSESCSGGKFHQELPVSFSF